MIRHGDEYKYKSGYSLNIPYLSDIHCFVFLGSRDPYEYEATNITFYIHPLIPYLLMAPQISCSSGA